MDQPLEPTPTPPPDVRVTLRRATLGDAQRLLDWRNDPQTIRMSRDQRAVPPDRHAQWLGTVLESPAVRLYIAEDEQTGAPVGTGRLDRHDEATVELSLTVDPRCRGRGYGTAIVAALIEQVADDFPSVRSLRADVRPENQASVRAFERFAFVPAYTAGGIVQMAAPAPGRRTRRTDRS